MLFTKRQYIYNNPSRHHADIHFTLSELNYKLTQILIDSSSSILFAKRSATFT